MKITLPNMPDGFAVTVESSYDGSFLYVTGDTLDRASVEWTCSTGEITYGAEIELPAQVVAAVKAYLKVSARYEYATVAHCPRNDGESYPVCGLGNFSIHPFDENPVVSTEVEFTSLPNEDTCWECRSIIA